MITGQDQPWFGKSAWGHPDFDRKSVRITDRLRVLDSS